MASHDLTTDLGFGALEPASAVRAVESQSLQQGPHHQVRRRARRESEDSNQNLPTDLSEDTAHTVDDLA